MMPLRPYFKSTGMILSISASLLSLIAVSDAQVLSRRSSPTVCNGNANLCNRTVGNVSFLGVHDFFAFDANPADDASATQQMNLTQQLALGARAIEGQGHWDPNSGTLRFCHTNCGIYNGSSVEVAFTELYNWLKANPGEVIIAILTNDDPVTISGPNGWAAALNNSGLREMVFDHTKWTDPITSQPYTNTISRHDWPTLAQLLSAGIQVLLFMDTCADGSCGAMIGSDPAINPEFSNIAEDPFGDSNETFSCIPSRYDATNPTATLMNLANHVNNINYLSGELQSPDFEDVFTTNSLASIMAHVDNCTGYYNAYPNILLMDFINIGYGLQAVDIMNGVPYNGTNSTTMTSGASQRLPTGVAYGGEGAIKLYIAACLAMLIGILL